MFKNVVEDLVELGQRQKSSTLQELAGPFIVHILNDKKMTETIFQSIVWPMLLPLFVAKSEKKKKNDVEEDEQQEDENTATTTEDENKEEETTSIRASVLYIALTCYDKGLKTDFEFLNDMDRIVKILLVKIINQYNNFNCLNPVCI